MQLLKPPRNFDTYAILQQYPVQIDGHSVTSTPLRYRDPVQDGNIVDATIHWCTGRGSLFISFPSRNPDYPGVRAGAIVPGSQYRQAKKAFLANGGRFAEHRGLDSFSSRELTDFEILVIGSSPDKDPERYPETHILGKFRGETHTSSFLRSTLNLCYGQDSMEQMYAAQRECAGSRNPRKAIRLLSAKKVEAL